MHALTPIDHLLALVLAIFFPIRSATFGYRRLARAAETDVPRVRRALYLQALLIQWSLSACVVVSWSWRGRAWDALGLVWRISPGSVGAGIVLVLLMGVILAQLPRVIGDAETLERIRNRLANVRRMLPSSREEMGMFYALSLTAGVCEELLYRGYLFDYARHFLAWPAAAAIAVLLFAAGHSYQGAKGILTTGIAGVVLTALYLVSGSLYLSMVAHALIDAYSGTLGRYAFGALATGADAAASGLAEGAVAAPPGPAASRGDPPSGT